jgi:release factor glutamine methyltransferase
VQCDLLAGIGTNIADIIVSNPPYIPSGHIPCLQPEVGDYEPKFALDGGWNGCKVIEKLLDEAKESLKIDGILAFEIGAGMGEEVPEIIHRHGWTLIDLRKDYSGIDRMVIAQPVK